MAYKLDYNVPEGSNNSPFDLGVKAGAHPLNMLFHNEVLFVLDCGTQFSYVNDEDGTRGDGKITAVAKDGSSMETVLSNVGNAAFNDPFYGWIDNEQIYFAGIQVSDASVSTNVTWHSAPAMPNTIISFRTIGSNITVTRGNTVQ